MSRIADFCLKHEYGLRKAVAEKIEDSNTPKTGGGSSSHSFVSDPTCQKAIKHIMPIGPVYVPYGPKVYGKCNVRLVYNPQEWLLAIEDTWEHFRFKKTYHSIMMEWYVEGKRCITIAKERKISDKRVYAILSKIRDYCLKAAKRHGAIKKRQDKNQPVKQERENKENEEIETIEIL